MIADAVQIVREDSQAGIAGIARIPFVWTTIQSMMLQTIDIAFYRAVLVGQFAPSLLTLPLPVGGAEFAFLGHDYFDTLKAQLQ